MSHELDRDLGAALLRIQNDTSSLSDCRTLLNAVVHSAPFRSRCSVLSSLVRTAPLEKRQELCRSLVLLLLTNLSPPEGERSNRWNSTTAAFAAHCAPPRYSPWTETDVKVRYKAKGAEAEYVMISPRLYEIVMALEDLWGVQGHLLSRSTSSARAAS